MEPSVKILKNLVGEFVTADVVKEAAQKDYNQSIWNNTVDRYSRYSDVRFFKTEGSIYEFDYYVIYIAEGIRFLQQVSYSSSLTNGGFAYGFYMEGCKNKEVVTKLKEIEPETYKNIDKDSITILQHSGGRFGSNKESLYYMKKQTIEVPTRFFTKEF